MQRTARLLTGVVLTGTCLGAGASAASAASTNSATPVPYENVAGINVQKSAGYFPGIWICLPQQPGYAEVIDLNFVGASSLPPGGERSPALSNIGPTPGNFRSTPG